MNIDWQITGCNVQPHPTLGLIVILVHYQVSMVSESGTPISLGGVESLPAPDPESFTPFEALQPEILIDWMWQNRGDAWKKNKEAELMALAQEKPMTFVPLPSRN